MIFFLPRFTFFLPFHVFYVSNLNRIETLPHLKLLNSTNSIFLNHKTNQKLIANDNKSKEKNWLIQSSFFLNCLYFYFLQNSDHLLLHKIGLTTLNYNQNLIKHQSWFQLVIPLFFILVMTVYLLYILIFGVIGMLFFMPKSNIVSSHRVYQPSLLVQSSQPSSFTKIDLDCDDSQYSGKLNNSLKIFEKLKSVNIQVPNVDGYYGPSNLSQFYPYINSVNTLNIEEKNFTEMLLKNEIKQMIEKSKLFDMSNTF